MSLSSLFLTDLDSGEVKLTAIGLLEKVSVDAGPQRSLIVVPEAVAERSVLFPPLVE